jgi:hypothetical protein
MHGDEGNVVGMERLAESQNAGGLPLAMLRPQRSTNSQSAQPFGHFLMIDLSSEKQNNPPCKPPVFIGQEIAESRGGIPSSSDP